MKAFPLIALLIGLGMTFGFLGDLFLASVLPAPDRVLTGIASFAVGHIFYILALVWFGSRFDLNEPVPRWGMLALWWLIGLYNRLGCGGGRRIFFGAHRRCSSNSHERY